MAENNCDLCDQDSALFLRARCHLTAPLAARKDGDWLILSCYLPECGREVARLKLANETAWTLNDVRQFLGWLSAKLPELHHVEIPRIDDALTAYARERVR